MPAIPKAVKASFQRPSSTVSNILLAAFWPAPNALFHVACSNRAKTDRAMSGNIARPKS